MSAVEGVENHRVRTLGAATAAMIATAAANRRAGTGSELNLCRPLATEREVPQTRYAGAKRL
jgi:hypothetical protein